MLNKDKAEQFFKSWQDGEETFLINTSGSTGDPKTISLNKKWMLWSAAGTAEFIQPINTDKMLCCLPVDKVGGMMMLVRSLAWQIPIEVTEPVSNPLLKESDASIISLTPFQLFNIIQNPLSLSHLLRFREVLIGGGEMSFILEQTIRQMQTETVFRHSYGMTETYSHIALRTINGPQHSDWFIAFKDVRVTQDDSSAAIIYTPFQPEGIFTNDIIKLHGESVFKVLGRKDFMINSGGVKLQPEVIEQKIHEITGINGRFIISSKTDDALGNKLVLVTEDKRPFEGINLNPLLEINPYAIPKELIELNPFPENEGGKTDRLKIREMINK